MCNIGGAHTCADSSRVHLSTEFRHRVPTYKRVIAPPAAFNTKFEQWARRVHTHNSCRLPARTISTAAMLLLSEISCTREALHVGRRRCLITHSDISSSNSSSSILRLVIHSLSLSLSLFYSQTCQL